MRILMLADVPGWIVDRNTEAIINGIKDIEFDKKYYTQIAPEFLETADYDIVHYQNWDIARFENHLPKCPLIITIRSHKYSKDLINRLAKRENTFFTVVSPLLKKELPFAEYIPNGIFSQFKPKEFVVGWSGRADKHPDGYKGKELIEQACRELGVEFRPASDIPFELMPDYYRSLSVYICASEQEGFSTGVMECLAMNVPVITVKAGVPATLNLMFTERDNLKQAIEKLYTQNQVKNFTWDKVCEKYHKLYVKRSFSGKSAAQPGD
jgi:glycosyltransferase involved in cell wall biosynthesis